MKEITVVSKTALEEAMNSKYDIIYVVGDLAKKIKRTVQLKNLSDTALAAFLISPKPKSPIVYSKIVSPGLPIPSTARLIGAIVALGASRIFNIYKEYNVETSNTSNSYKIIMYRKETFDK